MRRRKNVLGLTVGRSEIETGRLRSEEGGEERRHCDRRRDWIEIWRRPR
jgi:hypothetical protein